LVQTSPKGIGANPDRGHDCLIDQTIGQTVAMTVERVLLAAPRGFCAGVEMAIKALAWMVRAFDAPVYCYHEIVHNKVVVERFEALGVVFVDDVDDVPPGRPIMLSAHGSAPQVVEAARSRGSFVVDSVCPLVTKVHHEVKVRSAKGYQIVYVGHEGHEEAVGTMAVAPAATHRVESVEEVQLLPAFDQPVALLAQTTLSHRDWASVLEATLERFPDLWTPGRSDLCFATTNRQAALMQIAERCDAVVVIGSANSSNTRALERLAAEVGCNRVLRVNHAGEVPDNLSGTVGVTAGASAPEELVDAVLKRLDPVEGVEELRTTTEEEYFPPPRELRDLVGAIGRFAALGLGAGALPAVLDDRVIGASSVLATLR
jgi:4-hydroxy-3-methylbut-2-en-1-yl diphosphate reductase